MRESLEKNIKKRQRTLTVSRAWYSLLTSLLFRLRCERLSIDLHATGSFSLFMAYLSVYLFI
jgi:hypothetical protein